MKCTWLSNLCNWRYQQSIVLIISLSWTPPIVAKSTPSEGVPPESKDTESSERLTFAVSYLRGRGDRDHQSYTVLNGLYLDGAYKFYDTMPLSFSSLMTYRGGWFTGNVTPSAEELMSTADSPPIVTGAAYSQSRPSKVSAPLGTAHHLSVGMQLKLNDGSNVSASATVGVKRSFHRREKIKLEGFVESEGQRDQWRVWGCSQAKMSLLWLSVSYGGDPCVGHQESYLRVLGGIHLGRSEIGMGWGSASREVNKSFIDRGGPLAWVSLPLSAPLYLQMSVWRSHQGKSLGPLGLDMEQNQVSSDHFIVGLRWTGESIAPELRSKPKDEKGASKSGVGTQQRPIQRPGLRPQAPSYSSPTTTPL